MVNNNFKQFIKTILTSAGVSSSPSTAAITSLSGTIYYLQSRYSNSTFPSLASTSFLTSTNGVGIMVGSGTRPAAVTDVTLQQQITSDISGVVSSDQRTYDENGNPARILTVVLTNTGTSPLTIAEIGYTIVAYGNATRYSVNNTTVNMLIDRTLLDEPITIAAGSSAAINYTLKTII